MTGHTDARWLIDTNIIVHVMRGTPLGRHVVEVLQLRARAETPMISVVSVGEIFSLARRWALEQKKTDQLFELLAGVVQVDISSREIIERYAEIDVLTQSAGRKMGKNDLWIAASASVLNATLLTADKDFDGVPTSLLKLRYLNPDASSWT